MVNPGWPPRFDLAHVIDSGQRPRGHPGFREFRIAMRAASKSEHDKGKHRRGDG